MKKLRPGEEGRELLKTTGLGCQSQEIRFAQIGPSRHLLCKPQSLWSKQPHASNSLPVCNDPGTSLPAGGWGGKEGGEPGQPLPLIALLLPPPADTKLPFPLLIPRSPIKAALPAWSSSRMLQVPGGSFSERPQNSNNSEGLRLPWARRPDPEKQVLSSPAFYS